MESSVDVSILVITYNHNDFIETCLRSILSQRTSLQVELIIYDDASLDGTQKTISKFLAECGQHPFKVTKIFSDQNQKSLNQEFMERLYSRCSGKYISILEGDDYWLDALKIKKQYDFLESNPDFVICATAFLSGESEVSSVRHPINSEPKTYEIPLDRFAKGNEIGTLTVMFRNLIRKFPDEFKCLAIGDYPLWGLLTEYGKISLLNEVTAFYRIHNGNYFASKTEEFQFKAALDSRRFITANVGKSIKEIWINGLAESNKDLFFEIRRQKEQIDHLTQELNFQKIEIIKHELVQQRLIEERKNFKQIISGDLYNEINLGIRVKLIILTKLVTSIFLTTFKRIKSIFT